MKAVVVGPNATGKLVLSDVPAPAPSRNEAVIQVRAISLNRGETRGAMNAAAGARPGWDIAGVVAQPAADGSGPKAGERVVGILSTGAWAEQVAVPTNQIGILPEAVSFEQAATLPVAGLTALYALEKGPALLGRKVLITGASGGVGLFAVELAAIAGAEVTAVVRQERYSTVVQEAGAHHVVADATAAAAAAHGPFNVVLESVGGASLTNALTMLAFGGVCVLFGASGDATGTIDIRRFFQVGRATLYGFGLFNEFGFTPASAGLTRIANLVAAGRLHPRISVTAPWTDIAAVAQRLLDRDYPGKAVLTLG
jgi:NADPH:quinone reductase-like Zn-dependent oxidoreductase